MFLGLKRGLFFYELDKKNNMCYKITYGSSFFINLLGRKSMHRNGNGIPGLALVSQVRSGESLVKHLPNNPSDGAMVEHAQAYYHIEGVIKRISEYEGREIPFSFKRHLDDLTSFVLFKETAKELGFSANVFKGKLWEIYPIVAEGLHKHLEKLTAATTSAA